MVSEGFKTGAGSWLPSAWMESGALSKSGWIERMNSAPPGWKHTVEAMKKHPEITNPFALSWYEKEKGFKPNK